MFYKKKFKKFNLIQNIENKEEGNQIKDFTSYSNEFALLIEQITVSNVTLLSTDKESLDIRKVEAKSMFEVWQKASHEGDLLAKLFIIKYELDWQNQTKNEKLRNLYAHGSVYSTRKKPRSLDNLEVTLKTIFKETHSALALLLLGDLYRVRDRSMSLQRKRILYPSSVLFFPAIVVVAAATNYPDRRDADYCYGMICLLESAEVNFKKLAISRLDNGYFGKLLQKPGASLMEYTNEKKSFQNFLKKMFPNIVDRQKIIRAIRKYHPETHKKENLQNKLT